MTAHYHWPGRIIALGASLAVAKFGGIAGLVILLCAALAVHVWYRRRYGRWMDEG